MAATDADHEQIAGGPTPALVERSRFQTEILLYLGANGEDYGLGIKAHLEEQYDEEVNHGRLYPNLDQLVEAGLIEKTEWDARTNGYLLTEVGAQAVRDYASRVWECSPPRGGDDA